MFCAKQGGTAGNPVPVAFATWAGFLFSGWLLVVGKKIVRFLKNRP